MASTTKGETPGAILRHRPKGGAEDLAFYDQTTDVLLTQKKSRPANDSDRALLLQECAHAMIDVHDRGGSVTPHRGEMAACLVQTAYSGRSAEGARGCIAGAASE